MQQIEAPRLEDLTTGAGSKVGKSSRQVNRVNVDFDIDNKSLMLTVDPTRANLYHLTFAVLGDLEATVSMRLAVQASNHQQSARLESLTSKLVDDDRRVDLHAMK